MIDTMKKKIYERGGLPNILKLEAMVRMPYCVSNPQCELLLNKSLHAMM